MWVTCATIQVYKLLQVKFVNNLVILGIKFWVSSLDFIQVRTQIYLRLELWATTWISIT